MKHILKFLSLFMLLTNVALMIGYAVEFVQTDNAVSARYIALYALLTMLMISNLEYLNKVS